MTPLKLEQKESIASRLAFIEAELYDLEKIRSTSWKVYQSQNEVRRNIERMAENVANACIDIAKIILAGEVSEMPSTYKQVIQKLGLLEIIPGELANELAELIDIRNTLAHQYLDLKWKKIKYFLDKGPEIVKAYAALAQKLLSV